QVAVVALVVEVEALELLVGSHVEAERVGARVIDGSAGGALSEAALCGVFGTVKAQATRRVDARGNVVDPPVDEVEVVARLVDEKASRVLLLAVPATEVVGAVR